ncbi:MAG: hypothetical protein Q7S52_01060 [bacterium]|nr:hypothetical protein [bacterium]
MSENSNDSIVGRRVLVKFCAMPKHGDIEGCVCRLIGRVVRIGQKSNTVPPTYEIAGGTHYVEQRQVVLMPSYTKTQRKK